MAAAPLKSCGHSGSPPGAPQKPGRRPARCAQRRLCWVTCLRTPGCDWPSCWCRQTPGARAEHRGAAAPLRSVRSGRGVLGRCWGRQCAAHTHEEPEGEGPRPCRSCAKAAGAPATRCLGAEEWPRDARGRGAASGRHPLGRPRGRASQTCRWVGEHPGSRPPGSGSPGPARGGGRGGPRGHAPQVGVGVSQASRGRGGGGAVLGVTCPGSGSPRPAIGGRVFRVTCPGSGWGGLPDQPSGGRSSGSRTPGRGLPDQPSGGGSSGSRTPGRGLPDQPEEWGGSVLTVPYPGSGSPLEPAGSPERCRRP